MANYKVVSPQQVISLFEQALAEQWGYILNKAGSIWTQKQQNSATDSKIKQYGQKWVGKRVADCSGLFSWAFNKLGSYMCHGSNTMWNKYTVDKGNLVKGKRSDGKPLKPCTALFKLKDGDDRYHVGLWTGTKIIEAKGTAYGVVSSSKLSDWDEWGELKYVKYEEDNAMSNTETGITYPTIRQGVKGDIVTMMQDILSKNGSTLQVDGIFGSGTASALRAFQKAHGLEVDGVCGPKTWAALLESAKGIEAVGKAVAEEAKEKEYSLEEKINILWAAHPELYQ